MRNVPPGINTISPHGETSRTNVSELPPANGWPTFIVRLRFSGPRPKTSETKQDKIITPPKCPHQGLPISVWRRYLWLALLIELVSSALRCDPNDTPRRKQTEQHHWQVDLASSGHNLGEALQGFAGMGGAPCYPVKVS